MAGQANDARNTGIGCLVLLILSVLMGACGAFVTYVVPDDEPTRAEVRKERREERRQALERAATGTCNNLSGFYAPLVAVDRRHSPPRAICERIDLTYVAVTIGKRDRRWWRVVKRGDRWANASGAKTGRIPSQVSDEPYVPPAPDPYVPPPAPDPYNGPRCYAPGGKTYTPC